jgi:hypothetical protein
LQGSGLVTGNLSAGSSGTVAPSAAATLTVSSNIALNGTALLAINRLSAPNSAKLASTSGTITLGSTLVVTNIGPLLHVGDSFTLFGGALSGGFGSVTLPNYYTWDTANLAVNGTIIVAAILPPPSFNSIMISGGNVSLVATNGAPNGPLVVLTSTNLTVPFANWTPIDTNVFDGSGSYSLSPAVDPNAPQAFYLLSVH